MDEFEIADNPDARRYELRHQGQLIGDIEYELRGPTVALIHTKVDEQFGGRGLAARLVAFALADVRAAGRQVLPVCPYVRRYVGEHQEWWDIVADQAAAESAGD